MSADLQTVSLVHSLVLCLEFFKHACSMATNYCKLDPKMRAEMLLGFEFGVVKGVTGLDDVISTLPSEYQPHNLFVNYDAMMGVDRQANRIASYIPRFLISSDLEDMLAERALETYMQAKLNA